MQVSAGFIIFDKTTHKVLACHPTNGVSGYVFNHDIPKGHIEEGEEPLVAAHRELKEETGLVIPENADIYEIGRVHYRSDKALHLFSVEMDLMEKQFKCDSTFVDSYGNTKPEIDSFKLTDKADSFFLNMRPHVAREMQRRYGSYLIQFELDNGKHHLVDSYVSTDRRERLLERIAMLKDTNAWFCNGEFNFELDGEEYTVTAEEVRKAIVEAKKIVTDFWIMLQDKKTPYELFPFDDWFNNELNG